MYLVTSLQSTKALPSSLCSLYVILSLRRHPLWTYYSAVLKRIVICQYSQSFFVFFYEYNRILTKMCVWREGSVACNLAVHAASQYHWNVPVSYCIFQMICSLFHSRYMTLKIRDENPEPILVEYIVRPIPWIRWCISVHWFYRTFAWRHIWPFTACRWGISGMKYGWISWKRDVFWDILSQWTAQLKLNWIDPPDKCINSQQWI